MITIDVYKKYSEQKVDDIDNHFAFLCWYCGDRIGKDENVYGISKLMMPTHPNNTVGLFFHVKCFEKIAGRLYMNNITREELENMRKGI
jgi:hypothetical protein